MSIKDSVEQLYKFRDHYFESHSAESSNKKIEDLTNELNKTLNILDQKKDSLDIKENEYDLLKARALNVMPEFNSEALEILTKLVKFHPKLTDAWNELGTCFWKKGDPKSARSCFESALRGEKNAESLRNLSMILRQVGNSPEEKQIKMSESLDKAKEAVDLNIKDGKSWYVQGNAYLSLYFASNQDPSLLQQCLHSYSQAITDDNLKCNPDLYYNWATALKYDENYRVTLENLEKAIKYDPTWSDPKEQLESLVKHLENTQMMINKKGKLKQKRIKEFVESLRKEQDGRTGESYRNKKGEAITLERSSFDNMNVGNNPSKIISGKVVCHVYCTDALSFTFCMVDHKEKCFAVNVYNMVQGKGVIIGDTVDIIQPTIQHFDFSHKDKVFSFSSVRVNSPMQLIVNKKPLGKETLATPRLCVTLKL